MRSSRNIIFAALLGAAGCSSTKVTSTWKDPAGPTKPIDRVLVVGMVREEGSRRQLEEQLVTQLEKKNVASLPSHRFDVPLDYEGIKELVERHGFDAVLVSRYIGIERQVDYVDDASLYHYLGSPGRFGDTQKVKLETRLFSAEGGGRLLWVATTATVDPSSVDRMSEEVAEKIVDRLDEDVAI